MSTANIAPVFHNRRQLVADDLLRLQDPAVIFEHKGFDSDGVDYYLYTVAGWLNGANVATIHGGCTIGGEVILIHAKDREEADLIAGMGLEDTINALRAEAAQYAAAQGALVRLAVAGPRERMTQALKSDSDKSDAFINDTNAVRPLIGDDVVLAAGRLSH